MFVIAGNFIFTVFSLIFMGLTYNSKTDVTKFCKIVVVTITLILRRKTTVNSAYALFNYILNKYFSDSVILLLLPLDLRN
jgi:hypothetical protein